MSVDLCPDWQTLIEALEQERTGTVLGGRPPSTDPAALIRRANEANRLLAIGLSSERTTCVREALYAKPELNRSPSHWGRSVYNLTRHQQTLVARSEVLRRLGARTSPLTSVKSDVGDQAYQCSPSQQVE